MTAPLRDDDVIDLLSGRHETIQRFVTPESYSEPRIRLVTSCRRRPNLPLVYSLICAVGCLRQLAVLLVIARTVTLVDETGLKTSVCIARSHFFAKSCVPVRCSD